VRECRRFSHARMLHRRDRTGWLGREDSNHKCRFQNWPLKCGPNFPSFRNVWRSETFPGGAAQRVTCTPVQFCNEYSAPIAPPLRSSHAREAAPLDPRVRILPPQPARALSESTSTTIAKMGAIGNSGLPLSLRVPSNRRSEGGSARPSVEKFRGARAILYWTRR
jgi:hypothetical protein